VSTVGGSTETVGAFGETLAVTLLVATLPTLSAMLNV
jgi:hypothetical protein